MTHFAKRMALTIAAGLTLGLIAAPALAQDVEESAIELKNLIKGKTTLNPEMGYLFIEVPNRTNEMFMKAPDQDDVDEFEAEWAEEFEKAKKKYAKRLKSYERKVSQGTNPSEKPVEPTEETFSIGQIESRLMVTLGPQYVFDKGKKADGSKFYQYLEELKPGTYTYYGSIFFDPNSGALGACRCMGSWKFEVKAGEITSLGDFLTESWADDEAVKQASAFWQPLEGRVQKPTDWSVPETLSSLPDALPSVKADLRAAGKMNNFYRVTVLRSPPIEGVLRYERDTVIDVKAEIAAAQEAEALAKAKAEAEAEAAAVAATEAQAEAEGEGEGETAAEVAEASEVEEEASSAPAPATEP